MTFLHYIGKCCGEDVVVGEGVILLDTISIELGSEMFVTIEDDYNIVLYEDNINIELDRSDSVEIIRENTIGVEDQ